MYYRAFAYRPGDPPMTPFIGTEQIGNLAINILIYNPYGIHYEGLDWYAGPDESSRWIIVTTSLSKTGNLLFYGTENRTDQSLINLINKLSISNLTTIEQALEWIANNNYWTNYYSPIISAGYNFVSVLPQTQYQVWGWGNNSYGQLGNNSTTPEYAPISILGSYKTFCHISSGSSHVGAIDYNGQVWTWGYNSQGQLGDNTKISRLTPISIHGSKKTFCKISSGGSNTASIDYNGKIWTWGLNVKGQLGINAKTFKCTPVAICGTTKTFCHISIGSAHIVSIDYKGQIWAWGWNFWAELGDNSSVSRLTPVSIHGAKKTFCKISANYDFTLSIDYKGQVWGWGYNTYGQLGDNSLLWKGTPISIHGSKKTFCKISASYNHVISIDKNGQIWEWGNNTYGQLGDNSLAIKCTPVSIHGAKKTFCHISAGTNFTTAIDYKNHIWAWGQNNTGQIGINTINLYLTPLNINQNKTYCHISAGAQHTITIDYQGQVWGWGYNNRGQLGDNDTVIPKTPISIYGTKKTFCKISSNYYHTAAIDYQGQIWGWGYNEQGQLGDNTGYINRCTPVAVCGNKTFCNIETGNRHTIAIDHQGKAWAWGYNYHGQLGDNTTVSRRTPVAVYGNKTFCNISAGQYYTIAIDYLGKVWGWGDNTRGQLGDNTTTQRLIPVAVCGDKTFCHITTGDEHTIAIDYLGKVWTWGQNARGQLGDNTTVSRRTPVAVCGNKTFCNIAAGYGHTMAIDYQGKIWGWGDNGYGQLGDNTTTPRCIPVSVYGNRTFCNISAGGNHTIAIDYHGETWAWGDNDKTQILFNIIITPIRVCNF